MKNSPELEMHAYCHTSAFKCIEIDGLTRTGLNRSVRFPAAVGESTPRDAETRRLVSPRYWLFAEKPGYGGCRLVFLTCRNCLTAG